jgi:hypothetical protein
MTHIRAIYDLKIVKKARWASLRFGLLEFSFTGKAKPKAEARTSSLGLLFVILSLAKDPSQRSG